MLDRGWWQAGDILGLWRLGCSSPCKLPPAAPAGAPAFTGQFVTLANCNKPYKTGVFTDLKMPKFEPSNRRSAMAQTDDYDFHDDSAWFRDLLRQRDRLIAELTSE